MCAHPDLAKSVEELDAEYKEALRNLTVWADAIISTSQELPDQYQTSSVWRHAHQLYWQMEERKRTPAPTARFPM